MNYKEDIVEKRELGIYIHIPFCAKKCDYCDFISFPYQLQSEKIEDYIKTMEEEIDTYDFSSFNVTTIYIGGGTPSIIPSQYIEEILLRIKQKLEKSENPTKWKQIEITIEVNPGTTNKTKLETYQKVGINRLSIGLQTTNNKLLKQIGRIHTYEDFLNTYQTAKGAGFENVNVDLMLGLPNQTIQDLKQSLEEVIALNPNHISTYSLIVEEGTPIAKKIEKGELVLPDEEIERQMYWYVKNTLELNGYTHYEISNFAKEGKESKHNLNCWKQKEYIGMGVVASSYLNKKRYSNVNDIKKYIEQKGKEKIILENQTLEEAKKEYMLLGLRMIKGISITEFKQKYGENPIFLYRKELEKMVKQGLLIVHEDRIRLTNKGLDFANLVWEEFV